MLSIFSYQPAWSWLFCLVGVRERKRANSVINNSSSHPFMMQTDQMKFTQPSDIFSLLGSASQLHNNILRACDGRGSQQNFKFWPKCVSRLKPDLRINTTGSKQLVGQILQRDQKNRKNTQYSHSNEREIMSGWGSSWLLAIFKQEPRCMSTYIWNQGAAAARATSEWNTRHHLQKLSGQHRGGLCK